MMTPDLFERVLNRAKLAHSLHNAQPARWVRLSDGVMLRCDTDLPLTVADPSGDGVALSCGAALEAMVLALSAEGMAVNVTETGQHPVPGQGLVDLAHVTLAGTADADRLQSCLERRFTWRAAFSDRQPTLYGWTRPDMKLVTDPTGRRFLAECNDRASLHILSQRGFRHELRSWMRLSPSHPRAGLDGMDLSALQLPQDQAWRVRMGLGWLWPLLHLTGKTRALTAEASLTCSAPLIALFHREAGESMLTTGRAYLRLWLEATARGMAGWPMAAISDHPETATEVAARFGITSDRRLIQAIRFGLPGGEQPPHARRPLHELTG